MEGLPRHPMRQSGPEVSYLYLSLADSSCSFPDLLQHADIPHPDVKPIAFAPSNIIRCHDKCKFEFKAFQTTCYALFWQLCCI